MRFVVTTPIRREIDDEAERIRGESTLGAFTILPRHIDFVAALTIGLLSYTPASDGEIMLAVDGGTVVKRGEEVRVSTTRLVRGELGELREAIDRSFIEQRQHESGARNAMERIEADFIRRYVEFEQEAKR